MPDCASLPACLPPFLLSCLAGRVKDSWRGAQLLLFIGSGSGYVSRCPHTTHTISPGPVSSLRIWLYLLLNVLSAASLVAHLSSSLSSAALLSSLLFLFFPLRKLLCLMAFQFQLLLLLLGTFSTYPWLLYNLLVVVSRIYIYSKYHRVELALFRIKVTGFKAFLLSFLLWITLIRYLFSNGFTVSHSSSVLGRLRALLLTTPRSISKAVELNWVLLNFYCMFFKASSSELIRGLGKV